MAKNKIEHHLPSIRGNFMKARNEELRILNQFEKVLNKEITFETLVKERTGRGLSVNADMPHGKVNYEDSKEKEYIDGLINFFIEGKPSYKYIKFIGNNKLKPDLVINKDNSISIKSDYTSYKYGLLVYFNKNNTIYRFIFSPYVEFEYYYMSAFTIINDSSLYNYIHINKPRISKDLKYKRKRPSKYYMVRLDNGCQAAIPVIEPEDMMN